MLPARLDDVHTREAQLPRNRGLRIGVPGLRQPAVGRGTVLDLYALKCQLTPLSHSDYPGITFTSAEWAQLRSAFPTGVCNTAKPGVAEVQPRGTWLNDGT